MLSRFICVQLFVTLWTLACRAPLSMGFSRQEYWSGLPRPPTGYLPDPGIKSMSLIFPVLAGGFFTISATGEALSTLARFLKKGMPPKLLKSVRLATYSTGERNKYIGFKKHIFRVIYHHAYLQMFYLNSKMILQLKCISTTQMQTKILSPHIFLTAFESQTK